jgi:hypothetical protein
MAKKQTRKSVSISRVAYLALRAKCEVEGISMAAVVEKYVRELVGLPALPTGHKQACALCNKAGHTARTCGERIGPPRPRLEPIATAAPIPPPRVKRDTSDDSAARFLDALEKRTTPLTASTHRCSLCGEVGHNLRRCPEQARTPWIADAKPQVMRPPLRPSAPVPTDAQIIAKQREYERRAFDNPCRDQKCRIVAVHEAHGDQA